MTFDAYWHFGPFAAAAKAARETKRQSLVELQTELFMAARASHHVGGLDYVGRYKVLLPLFHRFRSSHKGGGE
ncbi:hypothetical protein [Lichenifustis flavocetrariae]|uniref:Uncharacterized protein n=1 Tax=Lichenifustis flavocetrariae TaxID=2949735 RepID=A0AA42CLJ5_9HYPH|nr:hypothetical protein [Lichenifustis flavocetrariae]MCW6507385.1 hypothetical protein [Lichenifustis flavocetrariae]